MSRKKAANCVRGRRGRAQSTRGGGCGCAGDCCARSCARRRCAARGVEIYRSTTTDTRRAIEKCTFDQARLIRHNRILAKNGIAPDGELSFSWAKLTAGTPLDRKAITRL